MSATRDDYFERVLNELRGAIGAIASAIWMRNSDGFLQLKRQNNINGVGIDQFKNGRQCHDELLRQAFQCGVPLFLEPFGSTNITTNPTPYVIMLTPITNDQGQPIGLLEAWIAPELEFLQKRTRLGILGERAASVSEWLGRDISGQ